MTTEEENGLQLGLIIPSFSILDTWSSISVLSAGEYLYGQMTKG